MLLVAGAGIGGLAAALFCARAGRRVMLLEREAVLHEAGAGLQLSPNALRVLDALGLSRALGSVAAFPGHLHVRDAASGRSLGGMALGRASIARHGFGHAGLHRSDLQQLLLAGARAEPGIDLRLGMPLQSHAQHAQHVRVSTAQGMFEADALIGCDGLRSAVRAQLLGDGPPQPAGQTVWRALLPQAALPAALRSHDITLWLAPGRHVVSYPVRAGELLNVVIALRQPPGAPARLEPARAGCCAPLHELLQATDEPAPWPLFERPDTRADQHARGRVALLGDAAHPMRPHLAQGAAMALEDAQALGAALAGAGEDIPAALHRYATARAPRNARVQRTARRNGRLFHADGPLRFARNAAMALLGRRLLDSPWLYGGW